MPIALLLQMFPVLVSTGESLYELIAKAKTALQQTDELNPDQEKERDAHFADLESKDWWKTD